MVYLASNVVMAALVAIAMGLVTCYPVVALVAAFGAGMLAASAAMAEVGKRGKEGRTLSPEVQRPPNGGDS